MSHSTWLLPLKTATGMEEQQCGETGAWPHEDLRPVDFKWSTNLWNSINGRHSICLWSCVPNWMCMWEFSIMGLAPGTHKGFPFVDSRFQGFAGCSRPMQAFSKQSVGYFMCILTWCCASSCSNSCCYFQAMDIEMFLEEEQSKDWA